MSMTTKSGIKRWTADNALAKIVNCGCKPDTAILRVNVATGQTPDEYYWNRLDEAAAAPVYAVKVTGSSGANSVATTAATGISAVSIQYDGVLISDPVGGDDKFAIPETYSTSQNYAGGQTYTQSQSGETTTIAARSTSVIGMVVRPTTKNGFVYELTTATGAGTTEPTWTTVPGTTCTDGGSNVWTCRTEKTASRGCYGLKIGASIQTDGQFCTLEWASHEVCKDVGDSVSYNLVNPM